VSRLRVLALSPVPYEGAGCRFRLAQYQPHLASRGIDLTIEPFYDRRLFELVYKPGHHVSKAVHFLRQAAGRAAVLLSRRRPDVVLIYREAFPIGPPFLEAALAALRIPLVYDFDDAVFLENTSEANRYVAALKCPWKTGAIIRRSDQVMAGNEYLASYARRYHAAVHVVPTSVDVTVFTPRGDAAGVDSAAVVGWIGTPTTAAYLAPLAPVLQAVARRHDFTFRVSGTSSPFTCSGVRVENVSWSLEREVELFGTCQVGVYPLRDDEWAQGKCGFKAIQFMACGVPVVAAAVGVNREIIRDGVNGFLATTSAEWELKLTRLLGDADLRRRIGAAGRRTVEERYSVQVNAPRVADVIRQAAARPAVARLAHASGGQR
jgi:glycosyltransferase involved in cell wall biosynthesis